VCSAQYGYFYNSLISCFPGKLFRYCLIDFMMVPIVPITAGILLWCCCLLSQAFTIWYFSWTNGDPHHSGFKFQTAVLPILCVMFLVQLPFVVNLLNVFLVWLPNFSWNQLLLVSSYISCSTFVASLYINSCILTSFLLPFARHFCLQVLLHLSEWMITLFVFNCYIWPICCNFSHCVPLDSTTL